MLAIFVHPGTYAQARSINAVAYTSQVLEGNETLYGFDLFEDHEVIIGRSAITGISYPDCACACQLPVLLTCCVLTADGVVL